MSHSKYSDSLYKFHGTGGNKLYDTVTHKDDDSPPPYNGVIDSKVDDLLERLGQEFSELYENPVEILEMFDTVVLLDDSSSMKYIDGKDGQSRWEKVCLNRRIPYTSVVLTILLFILARHKSHSRL